MAREEKSFLKGYLKNLFMLRTETEKQPSPPQPQTPGKLSGDLAADGKVIKDNFKNDGAFGSKRIITGGGLRGEVFFIDGMADDEMIAGDYVKPLILYSGEAKTAKALASEALYGSDVKLTDSIDELTAGILSGNSVYIFEGFTEGIIADTKGYKQRSVTEPENEKILKGPREGFIDDIMANLGLVRKRLQTTAFKTEFVNIGRRTNTKTAVCYIEGVADGKRIAEIKQKLSAIDTDSILDANYLAEQITENPYSPFLTIGSTERPDSVAGKLLEGRIAIFVNGSPVVLTLPYLFIENFQSPEDYYLNFFYSSFVRILRILSFFITVCLPGLFVALLTYHTQIIPIKLLLSILSAREGVPLPTVFECIMLILIFEILRETGIRVPSGVSQPLSIVGALVLGDAAVNARFVSSTMVIIIAMTALCGLMTIHLKSVIIIYRFALLLLGSLLGLYGFMFGFIWMCMSTVSLKSFGVKYTDYSVFDSVQENKDKLNRLSWRKMITRPWGLSDNRVRQDRGKAQ